MWIKSREREKEIIVSLLFHHFTLGFPPFFAFVFDLSPRAIYLAKGDCILSQALEAARLQPGVICYSGVISACAKGGAWAARCDDDGNLAIYPPMGVS